MEDLKEGEKAQEAARTKQSTVRSLQRHTIPTSLEFRTSSLKMEYSNLLNDIMEHGSQAFASYVIEMPDPLEKKEALTLVTSQFLSFQDFAEKMNQLIISLTHVLQYNSIEDLMVNISKTMRSIFNAEIIHLWMADKDTGVFFTFNKMRRNIRCFANKGWIGKAVSTGKLINCTR